MRVLLVIVLVACGSKDEPAPTRDIPCDQIAAHVAKVVPDLRPEPIARRCDDDDWGRKKRSCVRAAESLAEIDECGVDLGRDVRDPARPVVVSSTSYMAIEVSAGGTITQGQRELEEDRLDAIFEAMYRRDPRMTVRITADPRAPRALIDRIVARAKAAGLESTTSRDDATTAIATPKRPSVSVDVADDGTVSLDGRRVPDPSLDDELQAVPKNAQIVLHVDVTTPTRTIMRVVERVKAAGLNDVTFAPTAKAAATGPAIDLAKASLVLEVEADDRIVVGGRAFAAADLDALFEAAYRRDKSTQVVIRAARSVSHGIVVKLMEQAKKAGLTRLAIGASSGP